MTADVLKAIERVVCAVAALLVTLALAAPAYAAGAYEVVYEGDARQLVSADEDFFAHFGAMMPGDDLFGSVAVSNDGQSTQDVYFYTKPLDAANREEADILLDKIELSIRSQDSGKVIYEGPLRADELNDAVYLGAFEPGEEDVLSFELHVPAELTNEYAMAKNAVNWVFAVEEVPDAKTSGFFDKTGDVAARVILIGSCSVFLIAGIIMFVMFLKERQRCQKRWDSGE